MTKLDQAWPLLSVPYEAATFAYVYTGFIDETIKRREDRSAVTNSWSHRASIARTGTSNDVGLVSSAIRQQIYQGAAPDRVVDLSPGERWGWWSDKKSDQRVRASVMIEGAVNDVDVKILLDSEANISIMSMKMARQIKLSHMTRPDWSLTTQGLSDLKLTAALRARVKITLGWSIAYRYTVWIGDHNGGCDLLLGTDFRLPVG